MLETEATHEDDKPATSLDSATSSLEEILGKVAKTLKNSAVGPLLASKAVEELGRNWDRYEVEACGKTLACWLQLACGRGRGHRWFLTRFDAVAALGGMRQAIQLHHDAAVWAHGKLPVEQHDAFMRLVVEAFKANGHNPLTLPQARRIAKQLTM